MQDPSAAHVEAALRRPDTEIFHRTQDRAAGSSPSCVLAQSAVVWPIGRAWSVQAHAVEGAEVDLDRVTVDDPPDKDRRRNWWRWGRVELPVQDPSPETTTSVSDGLSSTARTSIGTLPDGPVTCP